MTRHCKVYMKFFDYGESDVILCEACGRPAKDIHHIEGRGKGKDVIENLIALCRKCLDRAHGIGNVPLSKGEVQYLHNKFISINR